MTELTPEEIESIDRVLVALMRGRAYQQWRRDQFIKAALTGALAAETENFCYGHDEKMARAIVAKADAAMAEADRSAQS